MPSTRGLEYHVLPDDAHGKTVGSDWVLNPTGGWMAVRKVALFTLSPTGKEVAGETAWWNWNGWFQLVRNTMTWLSRGSDQR